MGRVVLLAILIAILAGLAPIGAVSAAPAAQLDPPTSPCVVAATAALSKRGSQYVWGAKGPSTFDCSGIVYWAWKQAGFDIGISTYNQAVAGTRISCNLSNLNGSNTTCWAPGDIILLAYNGGQHAAIYISNGNFMDCYNTGADCFLHNVKADSFYQAHFWQARRIVMDCAGAIGSSATADPAPNVLIDPGIEQIPDMFPLLYLEVPQCNQCNASGVDPLPAQPEPQVTFTDPTSPFYWLAWRIGEYVRILLCFLLNFLQLLANLLQSIINALIGALNSFWRLLVYLWLIIKQYLLIIYLLFSDVWGFLQHGIAFDFGDLNAYLAMLWDFLLTTFALIGMLLLQLGALILVPISLAGWIAALVIGIFLSVVGQITTGTTAPAVLVGSTHPIYQGLRGALEGIMSSQVSWLMWLLIAMAYVGFIFWAAKFFRATPGGD